MEDDSSQRVTFCGGTPKTVQLNHAGASPSPPCVLDRVVKHMELEQQVGGYQAAAVAKEELQQVYHHIGRLIHCTLPLLEIALVESATVAWTRLFYSMATYQDQHLQLPSQQDSKKVILISQVEYAANVVACCHWVQQPGKQSEWTILCIPSKMDHDHQNTGVVDVVVLEEMLQGRFILPDGSKLDPSCIAMVCITHIPTNSGVINPVHAIGEVIAKYNHHHQQQQQQQQQDHQQAQTTFTVTFPQILYLVDACQSVGQMPIDVVKMQCHGLAATGRKYLRGPRGTGFLYVSQEIVHHLVPHQVDHASAPVVMTTEVAHVGVAEVDRPASHTAVCTSIPVEEWIHFSYQPGAARFEFWESNIANRLGLGRAVQYAMDEVGIDTIQRTIQTLATTLQRKLQTLHARLHVHHPVSCNQQDHDVDPPSVTCCCGIVTFWIEGMSAHVVQQALLQRSPSAFVVSVSPTTSTPLDAACLKIPDLVRASLSYTNTLEELEEFCQELLAIIVEDGVQSSSGLAT